MILLWRPANIFDCDFGQWRHGWTQLAARMKEAVVERPWRPDEIQRAWDRINITPGRYVIWVRPEFIPLPAFADELDVYRNEGQLLITLQKYRGVFELRHKMPCQWEPDGVSPHLVVFQLTGQQDRTLPAFSKIEVWKWLTKRRSWVLPLKQRWMEIGGAAATRSILGDTFVSPWEPDTAGTLVTGASRWWSPPAQLHAWREQVQAWIRLTSTSSR